MMSFVLRDGLVETLEMVGFCFMFLFTFFSCFICELRDCFILDLVLGRHYIYDV